VASIVQEQVRMRNLSIWMPAVILAAALYAVTIRGTFVWDDRYIASADPRLQDASGWRLFFIQAYRPNAVDNLWRPLTSLTYWVQWRMGGAAWALHLFNIVVHAGASAGVALLGYRLAGRKAGLIAGLLFAAHPVHVEGVAYLVGRAESLCALFGVGALLLFTYRPLTVRKAIGVFVLALASAVSKEQGLLVPVMLIAMWLLMGRKIEAPERTAVVTMIMLFTWTWAAYALYRDRILPWFWDPYFIDWSINPIVRAAGWDRALIPIALVGRCAALLVAPWHLSPDYGAAVTMPHIDRGDPLLWLGFAVLVTFGACLYAFRRDRAVLFCLVGLAIAWFPASNVLRIGTIFGERLIYFPSVFFILLVARLATSIPTRYLAPLLIGVLVAFSVRTVTYAQRWNDRASFYRISLAEQPRSAQLRLLCTDDLQHDGASLLATRELLAEGRRYVPEYYQLWTKSAEVSLLLGRIDEAAEFARRAAELEPAQPATQYWQEQVELARRAATQVR
jgi:hypothetical protein